MIYINDRVIGAYAVTVLLLAAHFVFHLTMIPLWLVCLPLGLLFSLAIAAMWIQLVMPVFYTMEERIAVAGAGRRVAEPRQPLPPPPTKKYNDWKGPDAPV